MTRATATLSPTSWIRCSDRVTRHLRIRRRWRAQRSVQSTAPDRSAEVTRIFANALESGELGESDRRYLGQLVAANTGMTPAEAEQRVTDTFTRLKQNLEQAKAKAKQVADDARKASAALALWLVVSLFVGAFVASLAATFGGRLRDSSVLANDLIRRQSCVQFSCGCSVYRFRSSS